MDVIVGRTRRGKPNSDTGGDFALVLGRRTHVRAPRGRVLEQAHDLIASPELRRSPRETISSQGSRLSWIGALPSPAKARRSHRPKQPRINRLRCRRTEAAIAHRVEREYSGNWLLLWHPRSSPSTPPARRPAPFLSTVNASSNNVSSSLIRSGTRRPAHRHGSALDSRISARSQSRISASFPVAASSRPSGENATPVSRSPGPPTWRSSVPVARSHSRTAPSSPAVASSRPSGEKASGSLACERVPISRSPRPALQVPQPALTTAIAGRGEPAAVGRVGQADHGLRRHAQPPSRPARGEVPEDDRLIAMAPRGQGPAIGGERQADHGGCVAPQPGPLPPRGEVPEEDLVIEVARRGQGPAVGGEGQALDATHGSASPGDAPPRRPRRRYRKISGSMPPTASDRPSGENARAWAGPRWSRKDGRPRCPPCPAGPRARRSGWSRSSSPSGANAKVRMARSPTPRTRLAGVASPGGPGDRQPGQDDEPQQEQADPPAAPLSGTGGSRSGIASAPLRRPR